MSQSNEIYCLASAMLEDESGRFVLGDYLEECGHPLSHELRTSDLDKWEIVQRLLGNGLSLDQVFQLPVTGPERLAVVFRANLFSPMELFRLACDMAEHVLPVFLQRFPHCNTPQQILELTRLWTEGLESARWLQLSRAALRFYAWNNHSAAWAASATWEASDTTDAVTAAWKAAECAVRAKGDTEEIWQLQFVQERLSNRMILAE